MILYRIRGWSEIYENNRTRELKTLNWIPIPNKQDGDGYTSILALKDGPQIYGAFVAIACIASRCDPRGTLVRDTGTPHTAQSLARMSRFPLSVIERTLECLSGEDINWLSAEQYEENACECGNPAPECDLNTAPPCASRARAEGKGMEQKGMEHYHPDSRAVLHILNEASGRSFRELDSNLSVISARLSESGVDVPGVRLMIERQCKRWKNTPQAEYLRPETLFGKTKFDSYYAARTLPVNSESDRQNPRLVGVSRNNAVNNYAEAAKRKIEQQNLARQVAGSGNVPPPEAKGTGGVGPNVLPGIMEQP